tara:strand:- start:233 stop:3682 length:3450 start_codon:yes stop_codon:yes gene_type:complete
MALDQKFFKKSTAAGSGLTDQEQGLVLHLDANDVDSYDGDGSIWYDIDEHEVNVPLADKASNLKVHLNASDTTSYNGIGTTWTDLTDTGLNATISGPSFGSDTVGYFDFSSAASDLITIPDSPFVDMQSNSTMEIWLQKPATTCHIINKGAGGANESYALWATSSTIYFYRYNSGGGVTSGLNISTSSIGTDEYMHVVITVGSSGDFKMYLNGGNLVTASLSSYRDNSHGVRIGNYNTSNSYPYTKRLSVVRYYNTALTAAEVGQNFRAGNFLNYSSTITSKHEATQGSLVTAPPTQGTLYTSNLAFHLDANGHSGTYWTDSVGSINGTINGATYVNNDNSDYFTFDGSNDTITFPATDTSPINFSSETHTIEFWINFNNLQNEDVVIGKWGGSNATKSFQIQVSGSHNKLTVLERDGGSSNTYETTGTFSNGTWAHFVYARSASQVKLYINGVIDSDPAANNGINAGSTQNITIGDQPGGGVFFGGKLAQLRIYSSTLDSSQVLTNYNATKDLYQGVASLQLSLDANGYTTGNWTDTSGNNRHAIISGNTAHTNDNNSDYFTLDGSGDYFTVAHNNIFNLDVDATIEMWIWRSSTTNEQGLMHKGGPWNAYNGWFLNWTSSVGYYFYDYDTASLTKSGTAAAPLNEWTHLVLSWNAGTRKAKMYINGAEPSYHTAPTDGGGAVGTTNTGTLEIGKAATSLGTGHPAWNGKIAQVRIYNGAMSETQVKTNYNATKALYQNPTILTDLRPTNYSSGTTWNDSSTQGNNATLHNFGSTVTSYYDQEIGNFFDLDGSNDYFSTSITKNWASIPFSVEMWFNTDSRNGEYLWGLNENSYQAYGVGPSTRGSGNNYQLMFLGSGVIVSAGVVQTNRWYHLVFTSDGTTKKAYLDGSFVASSTVTINSAANGKAFIFGRYGEYPGAYFNGKIGHTRVYEGALTAEQVAQNYLATKNNYPNGNNATISGSPTWGTYNSGGVTYNYFDLNGSSHYMTIPQNTIFDFELPTTLEVWVNKDGTGREWVIQKSNGGSGSYSWQLEHSSSGNYRFQMHNTSNGTITINVTSATNTGTWYHIAITHDGNNVYKIYLNGSLQESATLSGTISKNTNGVTIGKYIVGGYEFDGKIGMIKFYNKTFSATEVTAAYNNTKGTYGIT